MKPKNPATMLEEYVVAKLGDSNLDKNANAVDKSYNNFIMNLLDSRTNRLTRDLIIKHYDKMFGRGKAKHEFWSKEYHFNKKDPVFYFHDLGKGILPYCIAASTRKIQAYGRPYAAEYKSGPPKRFDSFMHQSIEFCLESSNDHAGAVALPDLFVAAQEYFSSVDDILARYNYIAQEFQNFIYILHNKFRLQGQSPFSNVTIGDDETLKTVFGCTAEQVEKTKALQIIFLDEISKGCRGVPFRFPVTTFNFALNENREFVDVAWLKQVSKYLKTCKFNIYISKDVRKLASCCRLVNDVDALAKYSGVDSFGNGGVNIGSARVITLNLPHIVAKAKSSGTSIENDIRDATLVAVKALMAHRSMLRWVIGHGMLKFFTIKWEDLDSQLFSTVGIAGLYEAASMRSFGSFSGHTMSPEEIISTETEILSIIKNEVESSSKLFKTPINIEQIPGESACVKLASLYKQNCWSNQYVPLSHPTNFLTRIQIGGAMDTFFTGGAITFLNLMSEPSEKQTIDIMQACAKYGLTHFAFNPVYSICKDCNTNQIGKESICVKCGSKNISYVTRIIGYFVPVESWSTERRTEFDERIWHKME